jgi:hypothetical protein
MDAAAAAAGFRKKRHGQDRSLESGHNSAHLTGVVVSELSRAHPSWICAAAVVVVALVLRLVLTLGKVQREVTIPRRFALVAESH